MLAGFRDDDVIASRQIDIIRAVHMVTEEHPKQDGPWHDRGEKALDGPIAPAFARPAGEAQHRHASRHHQQRHSNPAQLAPSRRWQRGSQALEECANVQGGLLPRHRVEVVGTITLPLRQKPFQINYHPQSGWFEETPMKGGTEQGYPLKGV